MKRHFLLIGWLFLACFRVDAQNDTLSKRIILIGDAGQLTNGRHPVVDAVKKNVPIDAKTTILFLGDNLYKNGLPDIQYKTYNQAKAVLDSQVSIADSTPARVYMIPGNHDWENGSRGGYNAILRQQLYIDFLGKPNVKYYPEDGCPGPVEVPVGNDVVLILFDSQWWLHPHEKPEIESDCKCKTRDELVDQISDIASRNSRKLVLLACHHPFKSNGIHGGFFTLKQHLFPLTDLRKSLYIPMPLIGSIYPIARSVFGTPQDLSHPVYANMITQVTEAIKRSSPNVVFVSGHDHNLQLIRDSSYSYIVSGGGCKQGRTSRNKNSLFNSTSEGFTVMEVSTNKNVSVIFYTVEDTVVKKYDPIPLLNFAKLNPSFIDTSAKAAIDSNFAYPDSVSASISKELLPVKGMKRYFMGNNYRKEWSAQVNMKIFNLRREKGGFSIDGLGGSTQTKSLRLKNRITGEEWVLRSMNKSPVNTIPETFRGAVVQDIATELKTSTFPYGAFITPALIRPLGLASASPELFFVPDDPALEFYRPLFANTVCMLEKRNASFDGTETKTTAKLMDKMLEENDHRPMQKEVLKARLVDMLVADYDRHLDQWRWGSIDTGKGKIYYPIPRDRDQSFFYSDGRLLRFIGARSMPFLKGFREDIPKVNWLNYIARDFDRIFLTDLGKSDWEEVLAGIKEKLTDSVIQNAARQLPPEIYALHGERIARKMISRRNALPAAAMKYYRFISKQVNIIGSNQKEYFRVRSLGDKLQVQVFAKSRKVDTSFLMYSRVFDPAVTKEIRLFGLHDEDVFDVDPGASSRIKLRIIGGRGIDTFNIRGKVEALLYDLKEVSGGDYYLKDSSHAKKRFSADPPVNERSILGFNYNTTKFPQVHLNYNSDDGLLLGAGYSRRTYGFRNFPYATDQRLTALYAPDRSALRLQYRGEFNHITRELDLLLRANYASPSLNNFFGLGNNSVVDHSLTRRFYQTLFSQFEAELLFRRRFFDKFHFMVGPYYYHYSANASRNRNAVLGKASQVGLNQEDVFRNKTYAGFKASVVLDNRNKEFFPTRGITWKHDLLLTSRISSGEGKYVAYSTDMSVYASLREPAKLVAVLKFGGGRIFSRNFEYFQAMSVGAQNDLPGFRKNRYAGKSSLYGGLELRMQLFHINSYIMPGPLGIAAFYNAGRVWLPGDRPGPHKWHGAYGVGVYYLPFNMFAISAYAGFSEGERMFNFGLGTKINLTY